MSSYVHRLLTHDYLRDDMFMMTCLSVVAIPILGLLLYNMDDDGGAAKEQEKAKRLQEENANYELDSNRKKEAAMIDAQHRSTGTRFALIVLGAIALILILWIEREEVKKLEQEAEREFALVKELVTMRFAAPLIKGIRNHPYAAPFAACGGVLVLVYLFFKMPGDDEYERKKNDLAKADVMPS